MKVIFLDFDGVVVPFGKASLQDDAVKKAVDSVNSILKSDSEIKIVVSSAWRQHGLSYCRRFLNGLGIDLNKVIGITGDENGDRGHQIQCYLNRNPAIKHFVILDDNSDMGELMKYLIKTSSWVGLTKKEADLAKKILNP